MVTTVRVSGQSRRDPTSTSAATQVTSTSTREGSGSVVII
jgi:hypothetical protein